MCGLTNVTAAVLAGGLGTRLRPALVGRPKVLADVVGRPFMAYLLDQLINAGIKYAVLCTGYLGGQVREMFGKSYRGLRLVYSQESSPLGTAGALRLALPLFKSDSVLVMNGDSFCDMDLCAFWNWHCAHGAEATLALVRLTDTTRYGRVSVASDGVLIDFNEKDGTSGSGWISAGSYFLNRCVLAAIPANCAVSLEREMFPVWIHNRGVCGYQSEGHFLDIGTPEAYREAELFFSRGRTTWRSDNS